MKLIEPFLHDAVSGGKPSFEAPPFDFEIPPEHFPTPTSPLVRPPPES